jgi:TRAP transporter TAXI family solute receptor
MNMRDSGVRRRVWRRVCGLGLIWVMNALPLLYSPNSPTAWAQTVEQHALPARAHAPAVKMLRHRPHHGFTAMAPPLRAKLADSATASTVTIVSGGINGTYVRIAADIASVLDDGDHLRILPILGRGSLQNIKDMLFMRDVDLGLVQSDALEAIKAEAKIPNVTSQVAYVARLYNEEIHILAGRDITDISQLSGKKVNTDLLGSGTAATAKVLFDRFRITPEITNYDQGLAYEKLKSGEIAASIYVSGKPVRGISDFANDGRFHLLAIPYDPRVQDLYFPTTLSAQDYPNLIAAGETVDTIAVGTILAVFNWPEGSERYQRLARFVDAFFSKFDEFLKPPRHPKWQEVNLSATVPGWTRFKPANEWLERAPKTVGTLPGSDAAHLFADFQEFIIEKKVTPAMSSSGDEQQKLFKEFMEWNQARKK